jgi:hypothetical protein
MVNGYLWRTYFNLERHGVAGSPLSGTIAGKARAIATSAKAPASGDLDAATSTSLPGSEMRGGVAQRCGPQCMLR